MKSVILTGGGSAGHVTPNIALIPSLKALGYDLHYIGTRNGIEKSLIENLLIRFHTIHSGKLRRYFDLKNFTDFFQIVVGFLQAIKIIGHVRPSLVFSKGGYVSCPVVWAAWLFRVPVVIHESDIRPGLANRLSIPFAVKICYSFPETAGFLPKEKAVLTGLPVREEFLKGNKAKGLTSCGFAGKKPVLLVIGGSQGSENLNRNVRAALALLLPVFDVCHICGKGNVDAAIQNAGYRQFEYVMSGLPDIFESSDVIISRGGATTIFEILAAKKASLIVPLGRDASRGDQIENAHSVCGQGLCNVLEGENVSPEGLVTAINQTFRNKESYINAIGRMSSLTGVSNVMQVLQECIKRKQ